MFSVEAFEASRRDYLFWDSSARVPRRREVIPAFTLRVV